jgi:hypothetical protein
MRIALATALLFLTGCSTIEGWLGDDKPETESSDVAANAPSDGKVVITKATWAAFENYKFWLTPIAWERPMGEGYFAVSEDGRSWGLTGCSANACVAGSPIPQDAVDICHTRSGGVRCSIFAKDQAVVVPYEVLQ